PIIFTAYQTVNGTRKPIYHTNVMMCLGDYFAVICLSSIDDKKERRNVIKHLKQDNKEIIDITEEQVNNFSGNMLLVKGKDDKPILVMSTSSYDALTQFQAQRLEKYAKIVHSTLTTIEDCGGGSARCMMAEVFLPKD
ncbi:MAG: amidinotransferase, partial [Bacteroidia bacterium]|nr:amidinotransferase [Bacteroidia bacterium]